MSGGGLDARRRPGEARQVTGTDPARLARFVFFAGIELLRQSLALFAVNRGWREAYAASNATEATRATMRVLLAAWPGINDALFHLLIFGFTLGTACYPAVLVRGRGLERLVGWVFTGWALMDAVAFALGLLPGAPELPAALSVTVQPLVRVLVGVWLWRAVREV